LIIERFYISYYMETVPSIPIVQLSVAPREEADVLQPNSEMTGDVELSSKLLHQIEYYFSVENLVKDKFLQKQMAKDKSGEGYVKLKLLCSFPKIQKLTRDIQIIKNSLKQSNTLTLNQDGSKVKRKSPFDLGILVPNARTIQINNIPRGSDSISLTHIFGICGAVKRVEIPQKKTGEMKGFAFVEFENEEHAKKAIQEFNDQENDFYQIGLRVKLYSPKTQQETHVEESKSPEKQESKGVSIYENDPTFHYSSKTRKKRSNSQKEDKEDNRESLDNSSRPKLNLKPRTVDSSSNCSPFRQPKGPDGTRGFSAGRGKLLKLS